MSEAERVADREEEQEHRGDAIERGCFHSSLLRSVADATPAITSPISDAAFSSRHPTEW
jgi:hypothetical protein